MCVHGPAVHLLVVLPILLLLLLLLLAPQALARALLGARARSAGSAGGRPRHGTREARDRRQQLDRAARRLGVRHAGGGVRGGARRRQRTGPAAGSARRAARAKGAGALGSAAHDGGVWGLCGAL